MESLGELLGFSSEDVTIHASPQDTTTAFTHDKLSQATTPDWMVSL